MVAACLTVTGVASAPQRAKKRNKHGALFHCAPREVAEVEVRTVTSGRNEDSLNRHLAPPLGYQTIELRLPGNRNSSPSLTLRKGEG